jgi:hypothetical protein
MNNDVITALYQSWYKMLSSLSDEERHNWCKLMFSEDPECHTLATEIFNSFGDSNFSYYEVMYCLNPNFLYGTW